MAEPQLLSDQKILNLRLGARRLALWLEDRLIYGLAALEQDPEGILGQVAAQLTDDQLPGLAGAFREWIPKVGATEGWAQRFIEELGYWHVLCSLTLKLETLDATTQAGIATALGVRSRAADVAAAEPQAVDDWMCIGVSTSEANNVYAQRTYWAGSDIDHRGVVREFNYGSPVTPTTMGAGDGGNFGVQAYPSGLPGRILAPQGFTLHRHHGVPAHHATWAQQRVYTAELLVRQPWRRATPLAVGPLHVEVIDGQLNLRDDSEVCVVLPLGRDDYQHWQLAALAGEIPAPCVVFGNVYRGDVELLSVWLNEKLYML